MPEPLTPIKGLGMKVARYPFRAATFFTKIFIVTVRSAVSIASSYSKSTSFCPKATSWWAISISIPKASASSAISRLRSSVRSPGWRSKYPPISIGVGLIPSVRWRIKNSSSGAHLKVNPSLRHSSKALSREYRGSPVNLFPSGV